MTVSLVDLVKGCRAYWLYEPRDAMYRVSARLVGQNWGNLSHLTDGLGVLLLTWHQSFYRFGSFDFDSLEQFLEKEKEVLAPFRARSITTFNGTRDAEKILPIFGKALNALKSRSRTGKPSRRSPVAVAKALHMLAPEFFPLWDNAIANGLGFYWKKSDEGGKRYLAFMHAAQTTINALNKAYLEKRTGLPHADNLAAALSKLRGRDQTILTFLDAYYYITYSVPRS